METDADTVEIKSAMAPSENYRFGTFWMGGPLSPFEQACINSFAAQNFDVTVFSYDPISNLPLGVRAADARQIVSIDYVNSFIYNGKPHLGHFSDYFRYMMIEKANKDWLRSNIFGREKAGTINGAILYLSSSELIKTLRHESKKLMHRDLKWGETGPLLLQSVLKKARVDTQALDYSILYPIHHDDVGKVFLAECRDWCDAASKGAATLHVFNNVISRMGYWKSAAPPIGSFLHSSFENSDSLHFFSSTFPESVMKRIVYNFRMSQTGQELGFKSILKQFIPSFLRSVNHHKK
jgi:hypothetical protein